MNKNYSWRFLVNRKDSWIICRLNIKYSSHKGIFFGREAQLRAARLVGHNVIEGCAQAVRCKKFSFRFNTLFQRLQEKFVKVLLLILCSKVLLTITLSLMKGALGCDRWQFPPLQLGLFSISIIITCSGGYYEMSWLLKICPMDFLLVSQLSVCLTHCPLVYTFTKGISIFLHVVLQCQAQFPSDYVFPSTVWSSFISYFSSERSRSDLYLPFVKEVFCNVLFYDILFISISPMYLPSSLI